MQKLAPFYFFVTNYNFETALFLTIITFYIFFNNSCFDIDIILVITNLFLPTSLIEEPIHLVNIVLRLN